MLEPEIKHERAQASQRATVQRIRTLLDSYAREEMTMDGLEVLALQLRLSCVNLMTCARELREVEEERKILLREMERQRLQFEPEEDGGV